MKGWEILKFFTENKKGKLTDREGTEYFTDENGQVTDSTGSRYLMNVNIEEDFQSESDKLNEREKFFRGE